MELIITGVSAQKTVTPYDHAAAAAYLMKRSGATVLIVTDAQSGQPAGIITQADIARAITDGKDLNDVRVRAVMTTRAVRSIICLGWSLAFDLAPNARSSSMR